jgi:hypothetical protein
VSIGQVYSLGDLIKYNFPSSQLALVPFKVDIAIEELCFVGRGRTAISWVVSQEKNAHLVNEFGHFTVHFMRGFTHKLIICIIGGGGGKG